MRASAAAARCQWDGGLPSLGDPPTTDVERDHDPAGSQSRGYGLRLRAAALPPLCRRLPDAYAERGGTLPRRGAPSGRGRLADLAQGHQHEGALAADQAVAVGEARLLGLVNVGGEGEIGVGRPAAVGRVDWPPAGAASAGTGYVGGGVGPGAQPPARMAAVSGWDIRGNVDC